MKTLNSFNTKTFCRKLAFAALLTSSNIIIAEQVHCGDSTFRPPTINPSIVVHANPLDNQPEAEKKTFIGGHIIGSLFSVVDEVDKLGGNAVKLISGSVSKINKIASPSKRSQASKTSTTEYRENTETENQLLLNQQLLEQLILSGQLELLLSSINSLPSNTVVSKEFDSQQNINSKPSNNYYGNSVQCPLRTRSITM